MSRSRKILRPALWIDCYLDRMRPVICRDARRDAFGGVNCLAKCCPKACRVHRRHRLQIQAIADFRRKGEANQSSPVGGHEVDRFRRNLLGGDRKVALVLTILVIDYDDDLAFAKVLDSLGNGGKYRFGLGSSTHSMVSVAKMLLRRRTFHTRAWPDGSLRSLH